jgi:hypothetical protein
MSFFQPCDKMANIQRDKTNCKKINNNWPYLSFKKNEKESFNTYASWIFVSSMMLTLTLRKQTNQPKKSIKILIRIINKLKKKIVMYIYFLFRHGSIFCFVIWFYFLLEIVLIYACGWLYVIVAHFNNWACNKKYEMFNAFIFWSYECQLVIIITNLITLMKLRLPSLFLLTSKCCGEFFLRNHEFLLHPSNHKGVPYVKRA